jgi:S-methylmethionine-dependent homocysteine/selenocysteine methylase
LAIYRDALPQLAENVFLTDTGLETTLIFHDGYELTHFAAFTMLGDEAGRRHLDRYYQEHAGVAARARTGFILEAATWRASSDWGDLLGYSRAALAEANRLAIERLVDLRPALDVEAPVVVSGCIGPRGDGYDGTARMTAGQARDYHSEQVQTLAGTDADMVHAMTITYPDEAVGVVLAAQEAEVPVAVSFTVETNGALPDGTAIGEAIERVDDATGGAAVGAQYAALRSTHPSLSVLGGCCGTDVRHLREIAGALTPV